MSSLQSLTDDEGNALSPVLGSDVKNYLIDIDGTICDDVPNEEPERMVTCAPYPDALEIINKWYDEGHITETWLDQHGFKYHGILLCKPRGGNYHWIDNHLVKATRFKGKFTDLVKATAEIEVFKS